MSYIHKPHTKPLDHRTPFQLLHAHVDAHPNKEAFIFRDENMTRVSLTFQEYEMKSRLLAAAFLEIGLVRGDRVLVMLPNSIEFVLIHMALNRIGALAVVTEEGSFSAVHGIKDLTCVIARANSSTPNHDKVVQNIQSALDENKLKAAVAVSSNTGPLDHDKVYLYEKLLQMGQSNPECDNAVKRAEAAVQMDDPTFVMFTSGTTSIPKPIQYTNHGYINAARGNSATKEVDEGTIFFSDGPFDWVSGLCMGIGVVIAIGSTLVVFPPKLAFQGGMVPTIMKIVEEEGCTHAFFVSYFLYDMTTCHEIHDMNLSKLKYIVTAGQPTAVPLLKNILEMIPHLTIINAYGATEANNMAKQLITKSIVDTFEYGVMDTTGGLELKIVNEEEQMVPVNSKGELCVRSAWISFCNWDLMLIDDKPTTGLGKNGWHFSKDAGSLDENGKLRLHGRMDDMIKCAALSISPYEMENVLLGHPEVKNVIVVGVPDQRLYEKMCACVILKESNHSNQNEHLEKELHDWCKDKCRVSTKGLAWKPHYYLFVDGFPLTRTGKFSRKLLREMAVKKLGL